MGYVPDDPNDLFNVFARITDNGRTYIPPEYAIKLREWREAEAKRRDLQAQADAQSAKVDALWAELCRLNGRIMPTKDE